jgi:signal transduction histidine kinase
VLWSFPYSGLEGLTRQGQVAFLNSASPAAIAGVQLGDRLLTINDVPLASTDPLYLQAKIGLPVTLQLERATRTLTLDVVLAPPPLDIRFARLAPLLIGIVFWSVGLAAWALRPLHHATHLFFLMSHATVGVLCFGALSVIRWPWSSLVFTIFLLLLAPLMLHFYAYFPTPLPTRIRRAILLLAYALAGLLILLSIEPLLVEREPLNITKLWLVRRSFVAVTLLAALVMLFHKRQASPQPIMRRRRLLIAGTIGSLLPMLMLSFVPELLWDAPLIDYTWTMPFFILMPFAYGFVLDQGELGRIDRLINRSLVYVLLTGVVLGLYLLLFYLLDTIGSRLVWARLEIGILSIAVAMLFNPLRQRIQHWVDHLFYGGWYNYRMVVLSGSAALGQARDLEQLVKQILNAMRMMRFQSAALLWHDGHMLVPKGSFGYSPEVLLLLHVPAKGVIARYLAAAAQLVGWDQVDRLLLSSEMIESERVLLAAQHVRLWLPLVNRGTVRGVLVLGERQGEVFLDKEDRDILSTLAGQATVAAVNVALLEALHIRLAEMERIQADLTETRKRLNDGREEERLLLAQELHDGPVQELYGILFELGALSKTSYDEIEHQRLVALQEMAQQVIHALRTICGELRPPALAPFGLEVAIRSHAQRYQEAHAGLDVQVDLMHDGLALPERMRLALFRIYQEAMNNIVQHAEATAILISLKLSIERVVLEVRDDGCGFTVPAHWITLARRGHLGLLGIAERAEMIGSRIEVISAPGEGTTVRVIVPRYSVPDSTYFVNKEAV